MTITAFDVYLVSIVDRIQAGLFVVSAALVVAVLWDAIIFAMASEYPIEEEKQARALRNIKKYGAWLFAFVFLQVIIPNSKTIAAMYVIPAIVNNQHIQNSAGNALEALEELTKEWLKGTINKQEDTPTINRQEKNA